MLADERTTAVRERCERTLRQNWREGSRASDGVHFGLSPLALPDLPEEIGRRLVEEYLLDPQCFWLAVPPTSVSAGMRRSRSTMRRCQGCGAIGAGPRG